MLRVLRCAKKAPQRPAKNANPSGLSEKMFILQKVCDFVDKVEISLFDRGGVGPSKKRLILVQRSQHKSTSDLDGAPKNSQFEAIFIKFGDAKKCYTFSGLELVPKSSKKLIGGLTCMHKFHKSFKPFGTIRKKIAFVENYKECAICAILRKKPFWGIPRG